MKLLFTQKRRNGIKKRGRQRVGGAGREGGGGVGASAIWSINYNNACNDVGHLIMLINLQAQFATVEASCKLLHVVVGVASCRCTLLVAIAPLQFVVGHKS